MGIGQGSYFRGWASSQPNLGKSGTASDVYDILVGQVLSVDYTGENAGKIRVRLIGLTKETKDDDVTTTASPANLNNVKYPLPGEIVIIVQGVGNNFANSKPVPEYYYICSITSRGSVTFNSDPFIGNIVPVSSDEEVFTPEYTHRFESKIKNLESYIKKASTGDILKNRPTLKPKEGDFILQSRFGSSIRFGSTGLNQDTQWSDKGGVAGDPIVIFNTNRTINEPTIVEDVNNSEASFYICSTQNIPVEIATSTLLTHNYQN